MALRVGEMMVVVRAQDFASRTLRRVGTDLHRLSREQQADIARQSAMLAKGDKIGRAQIRASYDRRFALQQEAAALTQQVNKMTALQRAGATVLSGPGGRFVSLNKTLGPLQTHLRGINGELAKLKQFRIQDFGHAVSGMGRSLQLIGLITTGIGAVTSNFFANFNRQVMLASTQTASSAQGIVVNSKRMQDSIIKMMEEFPAHGDEMAQAAYDIYSSMDVSFGRGMQLLRAFNKLSVATLSDLGTATNTAITVMNVFDKQGTHTNQTLNTMVATIRYGRMRLEDFNEMMNKIAPAAENANQSLNDVAGVMALITRLQPSQRQVATGIARLLQVFMDPEFQQGLTKASNGLVKITDKSGKLRPMLDIVKDIKANFGNIIGARGVEQFLKMTTAVGRGSGRGRSDRIEAQRALTFLVNNLDKADDLTKKINADTNEWIRSYNAMRRSPGVRWEVLMNQFRALALVLGEALIPVFLKLGGILLRGVQWIQNLSDGQKKWLGWIVGIIAATSLLSGVLLGLIGPIIAVTAAFDGLMVAAPWLALAAVIGLAALYVILHWKQVKEWFQQFWDWLRVTSYKVAKDIAEPFSHLPGKAGQWARDLKDSMDSLMGGVQRNAHARKEMEAFGNALDKMLKKNPKEFLRQMKMIEKARATGIVPKELIGQNINKLLKAYQDAWKRAHKKGAPSLEDMMKDLAGGNWKKLADQLGSSNLEKMYQDQLDTADQAKQQLMDTFRSLYTELEQTNRQIFGALFQGPFLTSPTFDLGKEWGITPAVSDMITDLEQQNVRFAKWRANMAKLLAEGVPQGLIDELSQMGMDAAEPFMNKLVEATPQQINKLIGEWKKREGSIKAATKIDFTREVKQFQLAGGKMGEAMINGFQSSNVGAWFDNWIQKTFPKAINEAVATAIRTFQQQHQGDVPKPKAQPKPPKRQVYSGGRRVTVAGHTDNSRTQTISITIPSTGNAKDDARYAAFKAKHTLKEFV